MDTQVGVQVSDKPDGYWTAQNKTQVAIYTIKAHLKE